MFALAIVVTLITTNVVQCSENARLYEENWCMSMTECSVKTKIPYESLESTNINLGQYRSIVAAAKKKVHERDKIADCNNSTSVMVSYEEILDLMMYATVDYWGNVKKKYDNMHLCAYPDFTLKVQCNIRESVYDVPRGYVFQKPYVFQTCESPHIRYPCKGNEASVYTPELVKCPLINGTTVQVGSRVRVTCSNGKNATFLCGHDYKYHPVEDLDSAEKALKRLKIDALCDEKDDDDINDDSHRNNEWLTIICIFILLITTITPVYLCVKIIFDT